MKKYKLHSLTEVEIVNEIDKIGFDKKHLKLVEDKYDFRVIKIKELRTPAANILKQSALSCGADVAVHYGTINCSVEYTDGVLAGTTKQIKRIVEKIKHQPFGLAQLAIELDEFINIPLNRPYKTVINSKEINWTAITHIMGIVNTTPDSFSDGGKYIELENALYLVEDMIKSGVAIIDIGGESTRPFSNPTLPEEQLRRILPLIKEINTQFPSIIISVDTRSSIVAEKAISCGAHIVNDVSGLTYDNNMIDFISSNSVPIIVTHSLDIPKIMQIDPQYTHLMDEITCFFYKQIDLLQSKGFPEDKIILDPGIGFGKTYHHNIEILNRIEEIQSIGFPVLVGVSRKRFINHLLGLDNTEVVNNEFQDDINKQKDEMTLHINGFLLGKGVNILRVHNYKSNITLSRLYSNFNIKKNG